MASQVQKYECVFWFKESKLVLKMTRRFHKDFSRKLSTNLSMYYTRGIDFSVRLVAFVKGKASASD